MKKYYSTHPKDFKKYSTKEIRKRYLMDNLFVADEIVLNYSFDDRIIVGSVVPISKELELFKVEEIKSNYFLENREMGIINIGGKGKIVLDQKEYVMDEYDGFYVSKGVKSIKFLSNDSKNPAKFYINSSPSHKEFPTTYIPKVKANKLVLGEKEMANKRIIYQYVHPIVCKSAQLCMGMTMLDNGSVWNTMPPHTHDRRMEVYLYFNIYNDNSVFHLMGESDETRHIVMKNEQVAISPSWSIHSGAGVGNYTFIWGMCGENQEFDDMDHIEVKDLK